MARRRSRRRRRNRSNKMNFWQKVVSGGVVLSLFLWLLDWSTIINLTKMWIAAPALIAVGVILIAKTPIIKKKVNLSF